MSEQHQQAATFTCEAFFYEMQPKLLSILRRSRIPPEDAEDILQESLLTLVYKWREVRNPEAWLIGVLRKKCLLYWRSCRRRIYDGVDTETLEWLAPTSQPSQYAEDRARAVRRALQALPKKCQRFLKLMFWTGLGYRELAERMGYKPSSIGKIKSRYLAALLEKLEEQGWTMSGADLESLEDAEKSPAASNQP